MDMLVHWSKTSIDLVLKRKLKRKIRTFVISSSRTHLIHRFPVQSEVDQTVQQQLDAQDTRTVQLNEFNEKLTKITGIIDGMQVQMNEVSC